MVVWQLSRSCSCCTNGSSARFVCTCWPGRNMSRSTNLPYCLMCCLALTPVKTQCPAKFKSPQPKLAPIKLANIKFMYLVRNLEAMITVKAKKNITVSLNSSNRDGYSIHFYSHIIWLYLKLRSYRTVRAWIRATLAIESIHEISWTAKARVINGYLECRWSSAQRYRVVLRGRVCVTIYMTLKAHMQHHLESLKFVKKENFLNAGEVQKSQVGHGRE